MANNIAQIIIQAIDKASKEINNISKSMTEMDKTADKSSGSVGGMDKSLSGMIGTITAVAGGVTAFGLAARQAFDLGKEGASLMRLEEASGNLAESMGSDMDTVVTAVSRASLGMVSDMDIMGAASRAMMLGVSSDADQLANLMEIAASKARAMGISTTQAFNDIVTGIGRGSPLILDNLGIVINAAEMNKAYAESIGKTAEQLTEAEKTQALLNSVLTEGNKQLEEIGGLTDDAATQFERFAANAKNAGDELKKNLAPAVGGAVGVMNEFLFSTTENERAILAEAAAIKALNIPISEQTLMLKELTENTIYSVRGNELWAESISYGDHVSHRLVDTNFMLLDSMKPLPGATEEVAAALSTANEVIARNNDHIAELATNNFNLAAAQQAAADTAGQQQIATLNLAEALKGATKVEFAKAFLKELSEAKNISATDLAAMSEDVMLHTGIISERSLAGAEGMNKLAEGLDNGAQLAVPLGEALDIINRETADGILDWEKLKEKLFEATEPTEELSGATDRLSYSVEDLNKQLPPAVEAEAQFIEYWRTIGGLEHTQLFRIMVESGRQGSGGGVAFGGQSTTATNFGIGEARGGEGTVPAGYNADSFPIFTSSNEKVTVQTPPQKFETDQRFETIMSMLSSQRPATAGEIAMAVRDAFLMIPGR